MILTTTLRNRVPFSEIELGKPFWYCARKCWGFRCKRQGAGGPSPNAVLLFEDGSVCLEVLSGGEQVVPGKEITIVIED